MKDRQPQPEELREVVQQFAIPGKLKDVRRLQRGHIHDTFVSTWSHSAPDSKNAPGSKNAPDSDSATGTATDVRFLHQRMNDKVFHDIPAVMHNIETVSRHLRMKMAGNSTLDGFRVLDLVNTSEDRSYLVGDAGQWRTYSFIENTTSFDHCSGPKQAFEAAKAFGWFQSQLADLDANNLRETLPKFFSTPHRLQQFRDALDEDPRNRAKDCADDIHFAKTRSEMALVIDRLLRTGEIPIRTVHGDTKLNNVLFCDRTGRAQCIVDLDTCMPGYSLYDFGDLVRFTAATSDEDERDLSKVGTDLTLYRALVDGYLDGTRGALSKVEVELMPFAARLVTYTIGLRFLADHLAGDVYFKVSRNNQNLDRARVQFRMVERMEDQADAMAVDPR